MKKKSGYKRILLICSLAIVCLVIALVVGNAAWIALEKNQVKAPGQMVEVNGKKVHVFSTGKGITNVVLLSGLGTLSPVIDFLPLVRKLEAKSRVTVVEYPGYGWSEDTDNLRSIAISVEETRAALRAANVLPPYILVPHSISGLQTLYFSIHYPEEVAGIVGLDISVPGQLKYMTIKPEKFNLTKYLGLFGIVRIALMIDPGLSGAPASELKPTEIKEFGMITNWNIGSDAIWNEGNQLKANFESVAELKFPKEIPITLVLASESVQKVLPEIPGTAWINVHKNIIEGNVNAKVVVMEGQHYIHHNNAEKIAELVFEVMGKANLM